MLEVGVAAAIQKTYMARHDLKAAKTDKSADTAPFIIALERARSKQRDAQNAHQKHVEEVGAASGDGGREGLISREGPQHEGM